MTAWQQLGRAAPPHPRLQGGGVHPVVFLFPFLNRSLVQWGQLIPGSYVRKVRRVESITHSGSDYINYWEGKRALCERVTFN